ncbi:flagellin [Methylobacterium sp. SD21]|uniref:flagellin N-terminal helical domain-containing protein n=1 Tax=Methylobacterium litchii TaxID=3138810 RepID=UPI00313C1EEC
MSNYDVTLSAATRQNLLSLQDTSALTAINQNRLSTGKKINSALDSPVNFFTASALNDRASTLSSLMDGISNGIQSIQAASKGIDSITSLVKQLQSTVTQAQSDAATNRPTETGSSYIAIATGGSLGSKSAKDLTLDTKLGGAAAADASISGGVITDANLGISATATDTIGISITAGSKTFTSTSLTNASTVRDVVNEINKSGIATASVGDNGKLTVTGIGSDTLKIGIGSGASASAATTNALSGTANSNTKFGFALLDATTGITATGNSTVRSNLISQFNDLTTQINQLAKDAGYNGTNLLNGDKLTIAFNEKSGAGASKLDVQGSTLTASNLGITQAGTTTTATTFNIQNDSDLSTMSDNLKSALVSLKSLSSNLGSSLSTVQTRQDFTKNITNVLTTGADNLTNADMNAEAANSQALSTRQSLGISALSLANTANQGILQLLR